MEDDIRCNRLSAGGAFLFFCLYGFFHHTGRTSPIVSGILAGFEYSYPQWQ
jgi:hypothetical protein